MAKPDCDDGWLRYAHELDAALAVADFTKGARIVLHEAFEQFFGPPKLKAATLSPTEIGALVGMAKQNVGRSIKELVDANVLHRNHDGTYRFNKNYETWTQALSKPPKVLPRLSPAEISFCRSAPARAVARGVGSASVGVINPDDASTKGVINPDDAVINPDDAAVISLDDNSSSKLMTNGSPPKNPLLGGRIKEPAVGAGGRFPAISPEHAESIGIALELFGENDAAIISAKGIDITDSVRGPKALTDPEKFACYSAALRESRREADNGTRIRTLHTFTLRIANRYATSGIAPLPVAVEPRTADNLTPSQRRREDQIAAFRKFAESGTDDEPDDSTEAHSNGQK